MTGQPGTFTMADLFTDKELKKIESLWRTSDSFHHDMEVFITDDKLKEMKQKGYEFDRSYLAYAVEYVLTNTGGKNGKF